MLTPTVVNQSSAPAANPALKNTDRQHNPDSFAQALNRSLAGNDGSTAQASEQKAEPARPSTRRPAARAADDQDQQPDQHAALGLALMQIDGKLATVAADKPQPGVGTTLPASADSQLNQALAAAIGTSGAAAVSRENVAADLKPAADKTDPMPTGDAGMDPTTQFTGIDRVANTRPILSGRTEPGQATPNAKDGNTGLADAKASTSAAEAMIALSASSNGGDSNRPSHHGDSPGHASEQFNLAAASAMLPPTPAGQLPPGIDASAPPVQLPLTPAVGSSEWGAALGKQVLWMGNNQRAQAELHLNPPELGPLKVALSFNDNQAQALFVSAHQSVRAAIEAALPQLRAALADNGISLGHTSVSADTRHQQPGAFAQHQGNQSSQPSYRSADSGATAQPATTERPTAAAIRSVKRSAIDTFA